MPLSRQSLNSQYPRLYKRSVRLFWGTVFIQNIFFGQKQQPINAQTRTITLYFILYTQERIYLLQRRVIELRILWARWNSWLLLNSLGGRAETTTSLGHVETGSLVSNERSPCTKDEVQYYTLLCYFILQIRLGYEYNNNNTFASVSKKK